MRPMMYADYDVRGHYYRHVPPRWTKGRDFVCRRQTRRDDVLAEGKAAGTGCRGAEASSALQGLGRDELGNAETTAGL